MASLTRGVFRAITKVRLTTALLVLLLSCCWAEGKKQTIRSETLATVSSDGKVEYGPKNELPSGDLFKDPSAFCEGCYGFTTEVSKLLKKWISEDGSMEDHIDTAFVSACTTERLNSYVLSPPKMQKLCAGILAHYEEEVSLALLQLYTKHKRPSQEQTVRAVCEKAMPACRKNRKPLSVTRQEERDRTKKEEL